MKRNLTLALGAMISLLAAACTDKPGAGEGATASSSAAAASPASKGADPVPAAAPDGGFVVPTLGEADAIEPPSRDIVPGMSLKTAKAKGAKEDDDSKELSFGEDIEVVPDEGGSVVSELKVRYEPPAFEPLKKKWGKPAFGDSVWLGKNWLATLDGCWAKCQVTFVRSPLEFLSTTVRPPGVLGNVRAGMTEAEVEKAVGTALPRDAFVSSGFGWSVSVSYANERVDELSLYVGRGKPEEWMPLLVEKWGPIQTIGSARGWVSPDQGWLAILDTNAVNLDFVPMKPLAKLLEANEKDGVVMLAAAALGKTRTEVEKHPGWSTAAAFFVLPATELSRVRPDLSLHEEDGHRIQELALSLPREERDAAKVLAAIETAWGPLAKGKDADGDEVTTAAVHGLKARVESDKLRTTVYFRK